MMDKEFGTNLSERPAITSSWDGLAEVPFDSQVQYAAKNSNLLPALPNRSPDLTCNIYLRQIEAQGTMEKVETFLQNAINDEYHEFDDDELGGFCSDYSERTSGAISYDEKDALKNYSGFDYKYINQVARGHWDYETLGMRTDEKVATTRQSIDQLSHAIVAAPDIDENVVAYRGTNLDSFHGYNIQTISDLEKMKNQFFLESGFTSATLDPAQNFAEREGFDDPLRRSCDVSIEYLISSGTKECAGLFSQETSYSPDQCELLIDRNALSYVTDVRVSPDKSSAKMQMILIPREIYDPNGEK